MENEGGYSDIASDPGGASNYGISTRFLRSLPEDNLKRYGVFVTGDAITPHVIKDLTPEQARLIYKGEFWDGNRFDEIFREDVRIYLFDCCVHHGHRNGIKMLQRSALIVQINILNMPYEDCLVYDGILGDETLSFINAGVARDLSEKGYIEQQITKSGIKCALIATRAGFMRCTAESRQNCDTLDGWLNRAHRWPLWE